MDLTERKYIKNNRRLPGYDDGLLPGFISDPSGYNPSYTYLAPSPAPVTPITGSHLRTPMTQSIAPQAPGPVEVNGVKDLNPGGNSAAAPTSNVNAADVANAAMSTIKFGADIVNAHQYDKSASDLAQEAGRGQSQVGDFGYETLNSIDASAERARVKKQNTQSTMGAMGSGAAAGATIGSMIGPWGTVIGGAVGAIGGLVGGLLGGKSRKRKMERAIARQQTEANIKNEFNRMGANAKQMMQDQYRELGDQNAQYLYGFKEGKSPVYSAFGPTNAEPDSKVSKGEVALNMATGDLYRIPTGPNDTALFAGGKDPNVAIITNKYGLSDYAMVDPVGAVAIQKQLKDNGMLKRSKEGFAGGKIPFAPNAITSGIGAMAGLAQYFGAKNDKVYRPDTYYSNPYANKALSTLAGLRVNELPITNQLRDAEARGTYALNNSGGLSGALKYLGRIANVRNTQQSIADALFKAQVQNNQYGAAYANALLQTGAQEAQNLATARRADDDVYMRSHAARLQGMQQGVYNFINYLQNYASNEFKRQQFNNMYDLYAAEIASKYPDNPLGIGKPKLKKGRLTKGTNEYKPKGKLAKAVEKIYRRSSIGEEDDPSQLNRIYYYDPPVPER